MVREDVIDNFSIPELKEFLNVDLFGNLLIRALSWKQPFGSLMFHDKIETRLWPTDYRGLVLICASQGSYNLNNLRTFCTEENITDIFQALEVDPFKDITGRAIGIARLSGCRRMTPQDEKRCFVKYFPDLWCHIYDHVTRIEPIPFKGKLKWSRVKAKDLLHIKKFKPSF